MRHPALLGIAGAQNTGLLPATVAELESDWETARKTDGVPTFGPGHGFANPNPVKDATHESWAPAVS